MFLAHRLASLVPLETCDQQRMSSHSQTYPLWQSLNRAAIANDSRLAFSIFQSGNASFDLLQLSFLKPAKNVWVPHLRDGFIVAKVGMYTPPQPALLPLLLSCSCSCRCSCCCSCCCSFVCHPVGICFCPCCCLALAVALLFVIP